MDLDMVLNELSISKPAPDIETAKEWMANLIHTARTASEAGVRRVIRTHIDINNTLLAKSYPLVKWRNDNQVDREMRRYFRSLVAQYPPLEDLPEVENERLSLDFIYDEKTAYGLGIAYLLECLCVSFMSHEIWMTTQLETERQWLDEDDNLASDSVNVYHASRPRHIRQLAAWIEKRLATGVENGADLWNRRAELFPSLLFCEHLQTALNKLHTNHPLFRPIIRRLFDIENYCRTWNSGSLSLDGLPFKAAAESKPTMQQYNKERTFTCPDGQVRTFSFHGRLTPFSWRIYFDPSTGPGRMIIGYIGPHLRTVRFPK